MPYTFFKDAEKEKPRPVILGAKKKISPFSKPQNISNGYAVALRGIAKEVGRLIRGYAANDPLNPTTMQALEQALRMYSEIIGPWALQTVNNVLHSVNNQDKYAWRQHTQEMAESIKKEVQSAPIGDTVSRIRDENVLLIKSIPLEAANRVNKLIMANLSQSRRSSELAKSIMETEDVTKSRATLIARTEVSKAGVALTQARAQHIGSEGYIWHTTGDRIVRDSHKKMNKTYVRWDSPPTLDKMTGHAGCFPNCRCWPEPVFGE